MAPAIATLAGAAGTALTSLLTSAASAATALAPTLNFLAGVLAAIAHATAAAVAFGIFKVALVGIGVADKVLAAGGLIKYAKALPVVRVGMLAAAAASYIWAGAVWALNVAMNANPISLIVIGIIALIAGIVLAIKYSSRFRGVLSAIWDAIESAAGAVAGAVVEAFRATVRRCPP